MESKFYGGVTSVEIVAPKGADLDEVHTRYVAMATAAVATDADRRFFLEAGQKLVSGQGADVVVLSGTDLFLAFDGAAPGYRRRRCGRDSHRRDCSRSDAGCVMSAGNRIDAGLAAMFLIGRASWEQAKP